MAAAQHVHEQGRRLLALALKFDGAASDPWAELASLRTALAVEHVCVLCWAPN